MQDPDEGSQPHRHDEVRSDGLWYDNVDQADCSTSPVIAALPELRPLVGAPRQEPTLKLLVERINSMIVNHDHDD